MNNEEAIKRIIAILKQNGQVKAKHFKKWIGISARSLRYRRVDIENNFINDIDDVLVEADNNGYFIVDIDSDEQVDSFIRRRKAMAYTMLKLIYKLEKAIMKICDMLDNFKEIYEQEEEQ